MLLLDVKRCEKRPHSQDIFIWKEHHGPSCAVCVKFIEVNKGGRKPKRQYSHLRTPIIWTKEMSKNLIEAIPDHHEGLLNLSFSDFDLASNPSLPLCKCLICENIMRQPVMLESCQHGFCLGCVITMFEGKSSCFECPYCHLSFTPANVIPCKVRWTLVENLKLKCTCGVQFQSRNALTSHQSSCDADTGNQMTVGDLLTLNLQKTSLPASVERATLRVLQQKIDSSNDGTAEFSSGGPRVNRHSNIISVRYK